MALLFLQSKLPGYVVSNLKGFPLLTQDFGIPAFCLLPHSITLKKIKLLTSIQTPYPLIVWVLYEGLFSSFFFRKKLLLNTQPLYFIKKNTNNSFTLYDQRYLKIKKGLYKLPAVQIDISTFFLKTQDTQKIKQYFLYPQRNTPFYFKGDTSDRLSHPPYLKALQTRVASQKKPSNFSIYGFFKKILDTA